MSNPVTRTLAPPNADDDGICLSQTPGAAGNLTLNGAAASGGVGILGTSSVPLERPVRLTFAADESGHNFTIYGTLLSGYPISEVIAGTTAGTVDSVLNYATVTRVAISAAATGAIKVGTSGVAYSPWDIVNYQFGPVNLGIACVVSGTINYTFQYTYDDFLALLAANQVPTTFDLSALASKATTLDSSITTPIRGWRVKANSETAPGQVKTTVIQAGIAN